MTDTSALALSSSHVQSVIEFLSTVSKLKRTERTGWVERNIPFPESVSDHMYRTALLCMMCPDTTLDRDKMIKMALYHDVGESVIGDISPAMNVPENEKSAKELAAVTALATLTYANAPSASHSVFGKELLELFKEYEDQESAESHFVRDMDLLEMILQANEYESLYPDKDLNSFYISGNKIKHPWAKSIFQALQEARVARLELSKELEKILEINSKELLDSK